MSRILFRILIYPILIYVVIIYSHAKYNDPKGFEALSHAFHLQECQNFFVSDVKAAPENNDLQKEEDFDMSFLDDLDEINLADETKSLPQSLNEDLKYLEKHFYDLALICNRMESEANLISSDRSPDDNKCYASVPYHHRVINEEMFTYIQPLHLIIEKSLKSAVPAFDTIYFQNQISDLRRKMDSILDSCGPNCSPLANIVYNTANPELPDKNPGKYEKMIADIKAALQSKFALCGPKFKRQVTEESIAKVDDFTGHIKASAEILKSLNNSSEHELIKPYAQKLKSIDETTFLSLLALETSKQ